jgi:NACHT domain
VVISSPSAIGEESSLDITSGSFSGAVNIDARHATVNEVGRDQHNIYINQVSKSEKMKEMLASLHPVERGSYHAPPCMQGTREEIIKEIESWLDDIDAPNILWLSGSPGAGKSAIASSLVSRLTNRHQLGSRFFFKRGEMMLGDPASLWRTVAHDLARFDPSLAKNLVKVMMETKVDPGMPDIALHFQYLIKEPLQMTYNGLLSARLPVIIIDGLDECDSDGSKAVQRKALISTLTEWARVPQQLKLIVTGRDDRVPESFRAICKQIVLSTGDTVSADTNGDIRHFFEERFAELRGSFLQGWPGSQVLDTLTARAAGLFIWADTVMKFMGQGLPDEQLDLVLAGDLGEGDSITQLYQQILETSFQGATARTLEVFKLVVSTIILAKVPLCIDDLCQIILESKPSVAFILGKLSSMISIQHNRLCIGHISFSDFLFDCKRCPEPFCIDWSRENQKFAMACFRLMREGLRFNICDLKTSHLLNDDVEDLSQKIETNIPMVLSYSCQFWTAHVLETTVTMDSYGSLVKEVNDFMYHHLLFWLEVMSLIKEVRTANISLLTVARWIQVSRHFIDTLHFWK